MYLRILNEEAVNLDDDIVMNNQTIDSLKKITSEVLTKLQEEYKRWRSGYSGIFSSKEKQMNIIKRMYSYILNYTKFLDSNKDKSTISENDIINAQHFGSYKLASHLYEISTSKSSGTNIKSMADDAIVFAAVRRIAQRLGSSSLLVQHL